MKGTRKRKGPRFRRYQAFEAMQDREVKVPPAVKLTPGTTPRSMREAYEAARTWAPKQEHGTWTPYVIEPMAESILAWVMARVEEPESPIGFLAEQQFQPLLDRWARSEARRMRFEGYVQQGGEVDERGNPHRLMDQLMQWEKRSAYHAERLGLDPLALAKIRRELAELHKEEDAVHALAEMQAKYARRPRPQVIEGKLDVELPDDAEDEAGAG